MEKSIQFKNSKVSFTDIGKGNAIIFLHGFLEDNSIWDAVQQQLQNKYRCIAIDLLGHGKSDCIGFVHQMKHFAESVHAVLRHLKLRKVHLIGHSLGGYVALAFAELYPANVKGLCLLNSTSNEDSDERKEIRDRAIEMAKSNYENLVKMSIANLFYQQNITRFSSQIETLKNKALQTPVQGYIAAQEGMKIRKNRNHILKNATFKKLMIAGANDPIIPLTVSKKEAEATITPLVILEGGHMSFIENKENLTKALADFLK